MGTKRLAIAAAAASMVIAVSVSLGATPARAQGQLFEFSVCNKSRKVVSVAISPRLAPDSKEFVVSGWWQVPGGSCKTIGNYPKGHFYMHASSGSTKWGSGELSLCVEKGAFKRINIPGYKCSGDLLRKFSHVDVTSSSWTWTLNP